MGHWLSLSLSVTTCCCEYKLADWSQVLVGILNFSLPLLWSVEARHVRTLAWLVPVPGFNYDHCQSPPLLSSLLVSPSLRSRGRHFPTTIHRVITPAPTVFLALMMGRLCWPLRSVSSVPRCTCAACLQVADVPSSVTLVTSLQSQHLPVSSTVSQSAQAGGTAHMDIIHVKCYIEGEVT